MYELLDGGLVNRFCEIDPKSSWLLAAKEKNLPIFTPGWEDSTLGNIFVSHVISGDISTHQVIKSGTEQMGSLVDWYKKISTASTSRDVLSD